MSVCASGWGEQSQFSVTSSSDSKNLTVTGPRPHVHLVSDIGSSPVVWYAISAEQADALPHVWQKGASAMGGLCGGLGFAGGLARASLVKVRQQTLHCCNARVQRVPALDLCNRVIGDAACLRCGLDLRRGAGVKVRQKRIED